MDRLARLKDFYPHLETRSPGLSDWSVAMQIEHILRARIVMYMALERSTPGEKKKKLTPVGRLIFAAGRFPRGRAKSPKVALPSDSIDEVDLDRLFIKAQEWDSKIPNVDERAWFKHPYFGILDRDATVKCVEIHDYHHIKIIEEMIAGS